MRRSRGIYGENMLEHHPSIQIMIYYQIKSDELDKEKSLRNMEAKSIGDFMYKNYGLERIPMFDCRMVYIDIATRKNVDKFLVYSYLFLYIYIYIYI